jgi:hypothetical protein
MVAMSYHLVLNITSRQEIGFNFYEEWKWSVTALLQPFRSELKGSVFSCT